MSKVYVRVDDRLIHGQTVVSWCPTLKINEIIAIDDGSASNPMLKSILTMSVPKSYKTHIVTTDEAKEILNNKSEDNRLVIVKYPSVLKQIKNSISGCEEIVLGNLAKRADSKHQAGTKTDIFFLSDQDVSEIDELIGEGFKVRFQQLPSTSNIDWDVFKKQI